MKQTFQDNPVLVTIAIVSIVFNLVLGFKSVTQYGISERLTSIEVELKQMNKKVDRLEDCVLVRKQADNAFLVRDSFVEKVSNQSEKEKIR